MTHEEALNLMLANSCHNTNLDGNDVFIFEGHCLMFRITAKLISTLDTIQYEIINLEEGTDEH